MRLPSGGSENFIDRTAAPWYDPKKLLTAALLELGVVERQVSIGEQIEARKRFDAEMERQAQEWRESFPEVEQLFSPKVKKRSK